MNANYSYLHDVAAPIIRDTLYGTFRFKPDSPHIDRPSKVQALVAHHRADLQALQYLGIYLHSLRSALEDLATSYCVQECELLDQQFLYILSGHPTSILKTPLRKMNQVADDYHDHIFSSAISNAKATYEAQGYQWQSSHVAEIFSTVLKQRISLDAEIEDIARDLVVCMRVAGAIACPTTQRRIRSKMVRQMEIWMDLQSPDTYVATESRPLAEIEQDPRFLAGQQVLNRLMVSVGSRTSAG